ncbi:MAG: tRNA epoxyqueuosine(34) reductase QueG [Anaeromyxobacter sp.]
MPLDAAQVKEAARQAGFWKAGVARAEPLDPGPLDRMLARGFEADMSWLRSQRAERLDPARVLPGARSVVALALPYHAGASAPPPPGTGEVARYARGRDYHGVMKKRLKLLVAALRALDPGVQLWAGADIGPVMEKVWAQRAGLGWVGKNGCLITPEWGSWVLLALVLTDRELDPDAPFPERCGRCAACLSACPTGAIPEPGLVDARRCISFWTIERRGEIPPEMAGRLGRWVFGCDDCQTVCPWNQGLPEASDPELLPRVGQAALPLSALLSLDPERYAAWAHGTALARARRDGLVRNALLQVGLQGAREHLEAVRAHLDSPHDGIRAAARWALAQLDA